MSVLARKVKETAVKNRVEIALIPKVGAPFLVVALLILIGSMNLYGMRTVCMVLMVISLLASYLFGVRQIREAAFQDQLRDREGELEAYRKMRELGVKGRPWELYFWESQAMEDCQDQREDIAVCVRKFTRAPSHGSPIRGYLLSDAECETVIVAEEAEAGMEPELRPVAVRVQYLSSREPEAPGRDGMMSGKDIETLTQIQTWVNQLNQQSEAEYRIEQREAKEKALPLPPPSPLEQKMARLKAVQQHSLKV